MICSVFCGIYVSFYVFFIVSVVLSFLCFYCAVWSAVSFWRINLSLRAQDRFHNVGLMSVVFQPFMPTTIKAITY